MELRTLGCWGAYPYKDEGTTSFLLTGHNGFRLLIDVGSRAVNELEKVISPIELDAVIISHYHPDHVADLGVLRHYFQLYPKYLWEPKQLLIYGHDEDKIAFEQLTVKGVSQGIAYQTDGIQTVGPFDISFIKTVHPVVCYAMRILERKTGQILVFTGDTGYFEAFEAFVRNADLLLADTYLYEGNEKHPAHLTSKEAGELAKKANVKRLVLTHLPQFAPEDMETTNHLEVLQKEAQTYAGHIPVDLAKPHRTWDLGELT